MKLLYTVLPIILLPLLLTAQQGTPVGWASQNGGTTGGAGGETVIITNRAELRANLAGTSPRILVIRDTIDLQLYERVNVSANKTIVGETPAAMIRFGGLQLLGNNIIIQNLAMGDFYDGDPSGTTNSTDCITVFSSNVWIDHVTMYSGADGLLDIRSGNGFFGDFVTVSYCKFSNHNKVSLVGASDDNIEDRGKLRVTFHHNWYDGTDDRGVVQRMPRIRFGDVHIFNTYYEKIASYAVAARIESDVVVEGNYFRDVRNPHITDDIGKGLEDPDLVAIDNIYEGGSGSRTTNGEAFEPADFYAYALTPTLEVPAVVMNNAGPFNYPENKPPTAVNDTVDYSIPTGAIVLRVTDNDTDSDGGDLRLAYLIDDGIEGITLVKDNQLTFIPPREVSGSDTIRYVVVDTQGGIDTGSVLIFYEGLPSSVTVHGESELIDIYPNPAGAYTQVELNAKLKGARIQIISASGRLIQTDTALQVSGGNRYRLDTRQLPEGLYVLSCDLRGTRYTKRLMVKK